MEWRSEHIFALGRIIKGGIKANKSHEKNMEKCPSKCGTSALAYMDTIRLNQIVIALCEEKLEELLKK